jgi:hypothetical protein
MLLLVGEQPAPNLLPARHLEPEAVVLVHSDRTERVAQNLRALLEPSISCSLCQVDPYDVLAIQSAVQELMSARPDGTEWLFNLTGGTKAMALAALFVAQERRYPFVYFQTEGNQSRLLHYRFAPDGVRLETVEDVPEIVSLDEYLRAYVGPYESGAPRDAFETEVAAALRTESRIDEMLTSVRPRRFGNLEIDVAVRCGNHVGIGEVKQNAKKSGVDQLAAASTQAFLGTIHSSIPRDICSQVLDLRQADSIRHEESR